MGLKEYFSNKIGSTQRRADEPGKDAVVSPSLPKIPNQPINVYSTDQAMKLSAAYRCTAILSGTIASMPLLIERKSNGYFSLDEQHELYRLLDVQPNSRMNIFEFIRNMVCHIINEGNAYIVIKRKFGAVSELVLCSKNTVFYDILHDYYTISDPYNHLYGRYEPYEVIHLRNNSLDGGYTGVSTITYASRIFSIAASADNQNLRTFQNGSKIKGLVSGKSLSGAIGTNTLSDKQGKDVGERIEEQFNGGRDIAYISGDMSFQQLSINPIDAQLLGTKELCVLDICRFYGVHPDKVFAGQPTNYKASEMSNVSFLTDTLQPILRQIETEFRAKLIASTVAHVYRIRFDRAALYQTDLTTQMAYYKGQIESGLKTPNEIRMIQGDAPLPGGDVAFISCNVAPINSAKIKGEIASTVEDEKMEIPKLE
ncbi:MAG: phage portal protein [Bacteroides oleiciplenus]|nr:phage portal protein [Bacteroides oleiciplenus]